MRLCLGLYAGSSSWRSLCRHFVSIETQDAAITGSDCDLHRMDRRSPHCHSDCYLYGHGCRQWES